MPNDESSGRGALNPADEALEAEETVEAEDEEDAAKVEAERLETSLAWCTAAADEGAPGWGGF